jgi:outer membrane protein TolC
VLAIGSAFLPVYLVAQQPATPARTGPRVAGGSAGDSLTIEAALLEARAANAQLPVAALGVDIARTAVREGRASRAPRLGVEWGLNAGGPLAYTTSQGALQLVATDTLFSGGLRRANTRMAQYLVAGAGAGYRIAQKDVDLAVRLRFADFLRADSEVAFRERGIARLRSYLAQVQLRKAAGQPVGGDVLTTQVRLGSEEASLADAFRMRDEARLQLNDLLGRVPDSPLTVVSLPAPAPPPAPADGSWTGAPDVRQAAANSAVAQAGIAATRSERRPQVGVGASLGVLPVFGHNQGTGPNSGSGLGGAVFLSLSMPLLDGGVYRARIDRAQLQAQQAHDSQLAVEHQTRLSYQLAYSQLTNLYTQVNAWARNVPIARDAYLQTQSMYNGGAATALEVLDAYTSWINASQSYADAVLRYRQADANYLRWGTP